MEQCAICHETLEKNAATIDCGHTFHYACIFRWHQDHETCPICRNVEEIVTTTKMNKEDEYLQHLKEILDSEELRVICKICNLEAYRCPDCAKHMCHCEDTNEYFYGMNPFSNTGYIESCLECFKTRDVHLVYIIKEFMKTYDFDDIFETYEIDDIYDKYYFNKRGYGDNIDGYMSFKDFEDFKSHAKYLIERDITA